MAYEKQTWQCGDDITAEKLNHMEEGISSAGGGGTAPLIVKLQEDNETLDHTWNEMANGTVPVWLEQADFRGLVRKPLEGVAMYTEIEGVPPSYQVRFQEAGTTIIRRYGTSSVDGYPSLLEEQPI